MNLKEFCLRLKLQQGLGITTIGKIVANFTAGEQNREFIIKIKYPKSCFSCNEK